MMGLDPGPLVRVILHTALVHLVVALANPLVMFVAYPLEFFFQLELSQLVTFLRWSRLYQEESSSKVVDS